jgi:hypothetical protein
MMSGRGHATIPAIRRAPLRVGRERPRQTLGFVALAVPPKTADHKPRSAHESLDRPGGDVRHQPPVMATLPCGPFLGPRTAGAHTNLPSSFFESLITPRSPSRRNNCPRRLRPKDVHYNGRNRAAMTKTTIVINFRPCTLASPTLTSLLACVALADETPAALKASIQHRRRTGGRFGRSDVQQTDARN